MNKIKKNDDVVIIAGKNKGKRGKVLAVLDKGERLFVEGIVTKKHVRPDPNTQEQGGIVDKNVSIHRSNVMIYDAKSKKGSRVGIRTNKDGERERFYKASNELVEVEA